MTSSRSLSPRSGRAWTEGQLLRLSSLYMTRSPLLAKLFPEHTVSGPTSLRAERTQAGNPSSSWTQHINGRGCKQVASELNLVVFIQFKEWYYFLAACILKPTGDLATWGLHSCGHHQWQRGLCPSGQAWPLQLTPGPPAYVTHLFTCWALWALEFDPLLCMWWSCSQDHQTQRWGQNGGAQG